ncbi:ArsR/SmtB family transcription factor [Alteromonas gilva]|uniref:Helix-turn-helix domain-containing protein n=1 Tax=Alteromonas gilva TaxID=2987522 RepID=A0ABT5L3M9_9ALTE|nr:helix-turn-helix domain-containing protein [Alteromonas gilva]MDC8831478.1 helix-turn-helix domain-containing protein [Alteromonas gilva]
MDIFKALSDPTRRTIIERLHRDGPQSIKQLGVGLAISRQALTKHLNRLISAKIVRADFIGKEKIHQLEPKPVDKLMQWLTPFAERWEQRLQHLDDYLGETNEKDD